MPRRADAVPCLGDASLRPEEDFVVVPATPEMQAEAAILSSNCTVAWLDGARLDVSCQQVAAELATELGARHADVEVVKHYPSSSLFDSRINTTASTPCPAAIFGAPATASMCASGGSRRTQTTRTSSTTFASAWKASRCTAGTTTSPPSSSDVGAPSTTSSSGRSARRTPGTWRSGRGRRTPMPSPK
uniref:Uncharacterized protein n=1 Tax=Aegilops tauschii subsp. strangulata TaxID=200361 RepID=A0A453P2Z8_AEGTS